VSAVGECCGNRCDNYHKMQFSRAEPAAAPASALLIGIEHRRAIKWRRVRVRREMLASVIQYLQLFNRCSLRVHLLVIPLLTRRRWAVGRGVAQQPSIHRRKPHLLCLIQRIEEVRERWANRGRRCLCGAEPDAQRLHATDRGERRLGGQAPTSMSAALSEEMTSS